MFRVVLLCLIIFAAYISWISIPVVHGYGELVTTPPEINRATIQEPFIYDSYTLEPVQVFQGKVRVLDKKRYYFDSKSEIASVDIVAGWQTMSDEFVLDDLYFDQTKRSAFVRYTNLPVSRKVIEAQTAHWHLIPSNTMIKRKIYQIREGHILHLEGWIVNVESINGSMWNPASGSTKELQLKRSALWVLNIKIE